RYSEGRVRSCSLVPLRRSSSTGTNLLDDRGDVLGAHMVAVAVADGDRGRVAACVQALDGPECDLTVVRRLAGLQSELVLERVEDALRADERAREVRAHLDRVPPDGLEVEHVVEARDPE